MVGFQGVPGNYGVFREVTGCSGGLRGVYGEGGGVPGGFRVLQTPALLC